MRLTLVLDSLTSDSAKMLLERRGSFNIDAPTASGKTLLQIATKHGNTKLTDLLMKILSKREGSAATQVGNEAISLFHLSVYHIVSHYVICQCIISYLTITSVSVSYRVSLCHLSVYHIVSHYLICQCIMLYDGFPALLLGWAEVCTGSQ